jgi:tetratricopeptide (TPR) repeat protein
MTNGDRPQPIAKGTLEQRPAAHLLIYARERRLRGTMEFGTDAGKTVVVFVDGFVAKIATAGKIQETNEQSATAIRSLFSLTGSTSFAYYDKYDALPNGSARSQDPLGFVWPPVRDQIAEAQIASIVDRTAQTPLLIPPTVDTACFGFAPDEEKVIAKMRDRATALVDLQKISPKARRIVYLLLVTKRVEAGAARAAMDSLNDGRPVSPPPPVTATTPSNAAAARGPRPSITPASQRSPTLAPESAGDHARKRIRDRAALIEAEDYFTMLGVSHDATADVIRTAFFALAKQWHPDRLPSTLIDVKEVCAKVFARMSEAYQTLIDPAKRKTYVDGLGGANGPTGEQEQIVRVVDAAQSFQKAEILFKRGDVAAAEALVRHANDADPKQAEYLALLAWIEATKPGHSSDQETVGQIEKLTQAIELNEKCERAYFYRAMLYKRLGNSSLAMKDFRVVVELNPRSVDAQRELRLFTMRGGKVETNPRRDLPKTQSGRDRTQSGRDAHPTTQPKKEEAKGLFGNFFSKKK